MLNYYHILGISESATPIEIKRAFKHLALKYHPDKNKGDKSSEEKFKLINEAYQILSDHDSKRKYDIERNYQKKTHTIYENYNQPTNKNKKTVYNRYGKYDWRNAPRYKPATHYKIDKNYFRNVAISFLVMIFSAAVLIGLSHYYEVKQENAELEQQKRFDLLLSAAQNYYDNGEHKKSLIMITNLGEQFPMEFKFYERRELLINQMNQSAISLFQNEDYQSSVALFEVLADHQRPVRMANYRLMAKCYLQLKDYENAAHIYGFIIERDPNNIELMLETAKLYEIIGDEEKVHDYYNEARYTFKKFQERSYGPAFEFVIDPANLPEIYYDMFKQRAELLMSKGEYEEAIKDCNWGIFMRPDRPYLYYKRAEAKLAFGQSERACNDLKRAIQKGYPEDQIKINIECL